MRLRIMFVVILTLLMIASAAHGQDVPPDNPFAPGIEVLGRETIDTRPPVFPTYTPFPSPQPRCDYIPYRLLEETDDWFLDVATAEDEAYDQPNVLTLCERATQTKHMLTFEDRVDGTSVSPSGATIIIMGVRAFYSYHFESDTLITLGERRVSYYEQRQITWYGESFILLREFTENDSFSWANLSIASPYEANSLQFIASVLKFHPVPWFATYAASESSPPYIEWITWPIDGIWTCQLERLFEDGRREHFDIGDLCEVGIRLSDDIEGDYLFSPIKYRAVETETASFNEPLYRDLVRLNLMTGERELLFQGEFERISDIDPTNTYATMILDDNGCFETTHSDLKEREFVFCEGLGSPSHYEVAIMDLRDGQILWRHPVLNLMGNSGYQTFDRTSGAVLDAFAPWSDNRGWVGGDLFSTDVSGQFLFLSLVEADEEGMFDYFYQYQLISLTNNNEIIEVDLPGKLVLVGENNRYFVLFEAEEDGEPVTHSRDGRLIIYDAISGQTNRLLNEVVSGDGLSYPSTREHRIYIERGDASDQLRVTLGSTVYTIRVPTFDD